MRGKNDKIKNNTCNNANFTHIWMCRMDNIFKRTN